MSWHCVKEDKSMGEENRRKVYQLDDAADVSSEPVHPHWPDRRLKRRRRRRNFRRL